MRTTRHDADKPQVVPIPLIIKTRSPGHCSSPAAKGAYAESWMRHSERRRKACCKWQTMVSEGVKVNAEHATECLRKAATHERCQEVAASAQFEALPVQHAFQRRLRSLRKKKRTCIIRASSSQPGGSTWQTAAYNPNQNMTPLHARETSSAARRFSCFAAFHMSSQPDGPSPLSAARCRPGPPQFDTSAVQHSATGSRPSQYLPLAVPLVQATLLGHTLS